MSWQFPLVYWHLCELPGKNDPGSFGAVRKHDVHTGIDLYVNKELINMDYIAACEDGTVVAVENYTGTDAGSPWWLPTQALLVEGKSGVICYGEISTWKERGDKVSAGELIGNVEQVLRNPPKVHIPNHSMSMLHIELYKHGTTKSVWWHLGEEKPEELLDPTEYLQDALERDKKWFYIKTKR